MRQQRRGRTKYIGIMAALLCLLSLMSLPLWATEGEEDPAAILREAAGEAPAGEYPAAEEPSASSDDAAPAEDPKEEAPAASPADAAAEEADAAEEPALPQADKKSDKKALLGKIPVRLEWMDGNDKAKERPESRDLVLLGNGEEVQRITLDAGCADKKNKNLWRGNFKDLPLRDAKGKLIKYELQEPEEVGRYRILLNDRYFSTREGFELYYYRLASDEPPVVSIDAIKLVDGKPAKGSEYSFEVYEEFYFLPEEDEWSDEARLLASAKNEDGKIHFEIPLDTELWDFRRWSLSEKKGDKAGIRYDDRVYDIEITMDYDEEHARLKPIVNYSYVENDTNWYEYMEEFPVFHNRTEGEELPPGRRRDASAATGEGQEALASALLLMAAGAYVLRRTAKGKR